MHQIRNIIFDLGGVILDIDFGRTEKAFTELGVENFKDLFGLGHASSFFKDHEAGRISDDEFIASLIKLTEKPYDADEVQKAYNALLVSFPPERIEFLKKLKTRYRLFLLSNTNGIHFNAFQKIYKEAFANGSFDALFEKAYYSHLTGIRKPNRQAYEFVLKENNLKPAETLFIDDAMVNVEAAREVGMQAIHLTSEKTILDLDLDSELEQSSQTHRNGHVR